MCERIPLSKAAELILESIAGDSSEVEDLSDIDDPVEDVDYHPPQQELSSNEEESSGDEDPIPQSTEASRGRKCLRGETCGYHSDRSIAISRTPRRRTQPKGQHQDKAFKDNPSKDEECAGGLLN
ncbi:hypothetical protein QTP70_023146 [Hemibagrus guttatus]|uniref:Uncharacterized protein n=1 Tax=Hemibagrus guttatus TaxID=175788 RepID=A0AAE0Q2S4_9TELE|nr:hypothetical protein QTP70_023146 [Hemibagrus guttatus]KAK3536739.1 hypothetical protein QTP86_022442 [Hemibagrus guttatus]